MSPEQETELLAGFAALQDTVERLQLAGVHYAERINALEAETTELKLSIGSLVREHERYDERLEEQGLEITGLHGEIRSLRAQLDFKGKRLETFHRHLEEETRARLEAQNRSR